jgi:catechol 2,3-dioxygenase-like lactoylglutathione lyase family enzyme
VSGCETIPSVRVSDRPAALRFYGGVLGFDVERGGPADPNRPLGDLEGNRLTFWQVDAED